LIITDIVKDKLKRRAGAGKSDSEREGGPGARRLILMGTPLYGASWSSLPQYCASRMPFLLMIGWRWGYCFDL
jgi:hypothetical protein